MSLCLYVVGQPPVAISSELGDFAAMFGRVPSLAARGFEVVDGMASPPLEPSQFSGLIVSGSSSSVLESEGWMLEAADLIRRCGDAGTPVLGVCFGHQLIARAYGGDVRRSAIGLQSSTWEMQLTNAGAEDPLCRGLPRRFAANLSHRDEITPSEDMLVLANGPHSIAAVAVGETVRGVQFHPEFGAREAALYVDYRADELGEAAPLLRDRAEDTPFAVQMIDNFLTELVDRA